jgi:transcriptional regulator with XRE-family HTH domain
MQKKTQEPRTMSNTAEITYEQQVGLKLKALRDKRKLTQYQVADGADVARRAYVAWEHGENLPSGNSQKKLAEFYGITVDRLIK